MRKNLGPVNALYPMPVIIAGALVDGKPNFITVAHVGIFTIDIISMGLNRNHYTNRGIRENRVFSINIPSSDQVLPTDYAGIYSGRTTDKSSLFPVTYGALAAAPLIENAPVSMACELLDVLEYGSHEVFVGKPVETWADEGVIVKGHIDLSRVSPMLFDMFQRKYWNLGPAFADCWKAGKEYTPL